MLDIAEIREIAHEVARKNLGAKRVEDVLVEPRSDSLGNDALRILVVIRPTAIKQLKGGEEVLATRFELGRRLQRAGEERFPIVEYATREELAASDDPEP